MGKLQVLPAQIANMIAAGEVVQRPASVVKELMENALDAGADQISVTITDAGRTLIQVSDNGCGMSPSDAVLCFERHATSKIASAEDLSDILTYGFRGEALASISAVAEVTLKTRREKDETGTEVRISDFNSIKTASVAAPVGSTFSIRNLFYNTPARRKFMKSDNVEFKHIIEEFTRIAIPHPEAGFTLCHNGKEIFVLRKAKSLKFRILDLLGTNVVGDVVDVQAETSVLKVSGFAGRPDAARKTLGNQYFFVCGRYFRSAYLHKAVMKAYEDLLPEGVTPSYFLFLEVDPQNIDVNIHPTKTEIKFEDENVIFQVIYASLKETLGRNSFGASIDFNTEGAVPLPQLGNSFEQYRGGVASPELLVDSTYDPFKEPAATKEPAFTYPKAGMAPNDSGFENLFESTTAGSRLLVIDGRFILTPVASGVMAVNIRRARERILYERTLNQLQSDSSHYSQKALFPVTVQVGAAAKLLFDDSMNLLRRLGFDIMSAGTDSVVVNGVPEGYSCESGKVQQMVSDLAVILSEGSASALPELMRQQMANKFATLGASAADRLTDPAEARRLIDTLFSCDNAELTSGGRRIVSILSLDELEKMFN